MSRDPGTILLVAFAVITTFRALGILANIRELLRITAADAQARMIDREAAANVTGTDSRNVVPIERRPRRVDDPPER